MAGAKAQPKPPSAARRTVGMLLAFVTSGVIHEGMFWYAEGRVTGLWLTFFSLQVRASHVPPCRLLFMAGFSTCRAKLLSTLGYFLLRTCGCRGRALTSAIPGVSRCNWTS